MRKIKSCGLKQQSSLFILRSSQLAHEQQRQQQYMYKKLRKKKKWRIRWRWDLRKYKIKLTTHLTHKWSTYTDTREFNSGKQYTGTRANFYMYNALVDGWVFGAFADFFFFSLFNFTKAVFSTSNALLCSFSVVYIHFTSSLVFAILKKCLKNQFFVFFSLLLFAAADCSFQ